MTGASLSRFAASLYMAARAICVKRGDRYMGVFRFDTKYGAPSPEQRGRYMRGECEEHVFGDEGEIVLFLYDEAAYLKDDSEGVRILFTGVQDKGKVQDEIRRMLDDHGQKRERPDEFSHGGR